MDRRVIIVDLLSATESIIWDEFAASSSGKRLKGDLTASSTHGSLSSFELNVPCASLALPR